MSRAGILNIKINVNNDLVTISDAKPLKRV